MTETRHIAPFVLVLCIGRGVLLKHPLSSLRRCCCPLVVGLFFFFFHTQTLTHINMHIRFGTVCLF